MGNVLVINEEGKREEIFVKVGDIFKDGNKWKLVAPNGIDTYKTKKMALAVKKIMID